LGAEPVRTIDGPKAVETESLGKPMSESMELKAGTLLELLTAALPHAALDYERAGAQHRFLIAFEGRNHVIPLSDRWFETQTEQSLTQVARTIATRLQATAEVYESA
jgi:transposase